MLLFLHFPILFAYLEYYFPLLDSFRTLKIAESKFSKVRRHFQHSYKTKGKHDDFKRNIMLALFYLIE